MSEDMTVSIYVLPTEEGQPPRAILSSEPIEEGTEEIRGALVSWQQDSGVWLYTSGLPVDTELGDSITAHAKALGVPGWE